MLLLQQQWSLLRTAMGERFLGLGVVCAVAAQELNMCMSFRRAGRSVVDALVRIWVDMPAGQRIQLF